MKHRDILNKHFCKDKIQIPTIGPEKIANFHFSHYKSMETIATKVLIRLEYKTKIILILYTKNKLINLDMVYSIITNKILIISLKLKT